MGKGEPSGNLTEFCTCALQDSMYYYTKHLFWNPLICITILIK